MGLLGLLGKIAKKVGKGAWWGLRRPETHLAASFLSSGTMQFVLPVVAAIGEEDTVNQVKLVKAINTLSPFLRDEFGITKESEIRFLIELAVQMLKQKVEIREG